MRCVGQKLSRQIFFGKKAKATVIYSKFLFALVMNIFAAAAQYIPHSNAVFNNTVFAKSNSRHVPRFHLPPAITNGRGISSTIFFDGKIRVLHFFGSWCIPCRGEQAYLATFARTGTQVIGVAVRDDRTDVEKFLRRYGNPFTAVGADNKNLLQKAFGSSGVPETFIINGQGEIIYRHVGELSGDDLPVFQKIIERGY